VADYLVCHWCSFRVPKFYTSKDGKPRSGWGKLRAHQELRHADELMELLETLGPEDD